MERGAKSTELQQTREFIRRTVIGCALSSMLFALCFPAQAQQRKNAPRIGFLSVGTASAMSTRVEAFRRGLREQGYVEGQGLVVEYRYAQDNLERLRDFAAELVRLKVDIIVTGGAISTRPAKEAAGAIPIVMIRLGQVWLLASHDLAATLPD